jgi:hypothetical protein
MGACIRGQRAGHMGPDKTLKLAIFILKKFDSKFGFKSIILVQ